MKPYIISQHQVEDILMHEGVIDYDAIEDPLSYDNGETELAVDRVTQQLNEIVFKHLQHWEVYCACLEDQLDSVGLKAAQAQADRTVTP